jgi:chromosome segregation ATPase
VLLLSSFSYTFSQVERDKYKEKAEAANKLEAAVKKMTREHEASTKSVAELRSAAVDLRNKLEDLRQSLSAYENSRGKLEQRLAVEARKKHDFWKQSHPEAAEAAEPAESQPEGEGNERQPKPYALRDVPAEELAQMSKSHLKQEAARLEKLTQGDNVHNGAILEYQQQAKLVAAKLREKEAAAAVVDRARELHEGLRQQRLSMFMEGFSFINSKLKVRLSACFIHLLCCR